MQTKAWVTNADQSLIYRVVGFLEYASALRSLDELVRSATAEELEAIDTLIAERPEFTVYTNLSLSLLPRPSTLVPVGGNPRTERQGLAWVLALARAEMGGILATFEAHPDPFAVVGPTQFEWNAYRDLLLDDAEVHFWSLSRDPDLERVAKSTPDTPMLAYLRRLSLARHLLLAAAVSRQHELIQEQIAELANQDEQLSETRDIMRFTVASYLASRTGKSSFMNKSVREVADACSDQLKAERSELQAGTAFVERIKPNNQSQGNKSQGNKKDQ